MKGKSKMKTPKTLKTTYNIIEDMCQRIGINCPELPSNKVLARLKDKTILFEGQLWLKEIFENEYKAVYDIRKLLPENIWGFYKAFHGDFKNHREVKMLKERSDLLERALMQVDRPDLFLPKKVTKFLKEMRRRKK